MVVVVKDLKKNKSEDVHEFSKVSGNRSVEKNLQGTL